MKKLKELIEKVKKNKITLSIFVIIWVVTISFTLSNYKSSLGMESFGNDNDIVETIDLDENTIITQEVTLEHDVNSISIKFATYARENSGNISIKVVGLSSNTTYINKEISVNDVLDNAFLTFGLDNKIIASKEKTIKIILTSDSKTGENIGVYYSPEVAFEDGDFYINDEYQESDLKVRFLTDNETLMIFSNSALLWSIIGISIVVLIIALSDKKEIVFAGFALVAGLIFIAIITPMSPPDEQKHYEYAYQISNIVLGEKDHLLIDAEYQDYSDFAGHLNVSMAYESFEEKLNEELHLKDRYEVMLSDIDEATYTLCYFPQVIAITICRLCKVNMLRTFYAGRLFNLLFYVACVYIGIKKTPTHKTLFGILATTPIFIQQAASYSYDSFLNALLLVVAGYLFNWLYKEEQIKNKEVIGLFIAVMLMTPLKVVYSLFVFCFIFVSYKKFGSKKRKAIILTIICAPVLYQFVALIYPYVERLISNFAESAAKAEQIEPIYKTMSSNTMFGLDSIINKSEEGSRYKLWHITAYFKETIQLYYRTVRGCIKIWFYEALGRSLSGVSLVLPLKYMHIFTFLVIASAFLKEKYFASIGMRISFVLICVAIGLFVMTGMLLTWTSVGDEIIQGIQGRYFSPLLFYFLSIVNNPKIYLPQKLDKYLTFANLIMVFEVIVYVMSYTFVN